ncbi:MULTISPECIES: hypothetical protein [Amycolatopsis]|uniref:hypothetical protein n=1 Tax=Amycolatopsis TaxID=1813 RepID=UPI000B8B7EAD|nr:MULTISPECIES: hypothetical protein [Amycolatopsis]OXM72841.1 hypothetical protein CF166_12550 [Amycolatopsis sp. KNN50.9b]
MFNGRAEEAIPLAWVHEHWAKTCPMAARLPTTEFAELLRLHGVLPEWTRSGRNMSAAASAPDTAPLYLGYGNACL